MKSYEELKSFLLDNRTIKDLHHGHRILQELERSEARSLRPVRVALLASYTTDFVIPLLKTELILSNLACEIYKPGFNQFRQELLDPDSVLYRFKPDVTIVGFGLDDVVPDGMSHFPLLSDSDRKSLSREILDLCKALIESYRSATDNGALLLQDFIPPWFMHEPLVRTKHGIHQFVSGLNSELRDLAEQYPNVHVIDYSRLAGRRGTLSWTDPRTYYTARIPVAQEHWIALAETYGRYVRAALNLEIKCLVLDLDNTLWGGILGEDGFDGISIGDTYPGNVFRRFQEYLLSLFASGYALAICSKNDHDDVIDVLRRHPAMILREEHFAAIKANWNPKEQNLREISSEIQISFDHMLFVDDNVVEIEKIRSAIPGMTCVHLQSPPINFSTQFENARCIGKLLITDEDLHRGQQYSEDRLRRAHRDQLGSIEDFYRSLQQRLTVYLNHAPHRARIAQLTQRTNQFNMATVRLNESDVERMLNAGDYLLITADLDDRFGKSGTVAFVQVRKQERTWVIENLLMSCRVLGRTIEERLMDHIFACAEANAIEAVLAAFVPTKKNSPFADYYLRNGFVELESSQSGEKRYVRRVADHQMRPAFAEITLGG